MPHRPRPRRRASPASASDVLRAGRTLRRLGTRRAMSRVEHRAPDVAEHLFEELTRLHGRLLALRGPPRRTRRAFLDVQRLTLLLGLLLVRSSDRD